MKSEDLLVVLVTAPSKEAGMQIADALLEARQAACVNILPDITSVYRWEGQKETSAEVLLVIKCRRDDYKALEQTVHAVHPYDVPEVVALSANEASEAYLNWVATETSK